MTQSEDFEVRLAAAERAIEVLQGEAQVPGGASMVPTDDALWALEGLRVRAPEGGAVLYVGSVDLPNGGTVRWQYGLGAAAVFAQDWTEQALALAALGNPVRLQILHAVLHGTTTVAALVEVLDSGTSGQVYHHLKELTTAGWLVSGKRGVYEVPGARVVPLLAILVAAGTPG